MITMTATIILAADGDLVTEVAGLAVYLDAVLEELLEVLAYTYVNTNTQTYVYYMYIHIYIYIDIDI